MTPPRDEIRNFAASVRDRLLALARARDADFNLMLQRYAGERFLYRLGVSGEVDRFVLKGAALFLVWAGKEFRATRDLDFLAMAPADHAAIRAAMEAVCAVAYPEDGLAFDSASIEIADIREDQEYGGVRVRLRAMLGKAILRLQVDIGFGDVINPERRAEAYPTLLQHQSPQVWMYPRETCIAEKFETMVRRGEANSRMRDFWDVAALAQHFGFDGDTLGTAIVETFRRRGTPLGGELPDALRPVFYEDASRLKQWEAFQRGAGAVTDGPTRFGEAGEIVRAFLSPVREHLMHDHPFLLVWPAGGPWLSAETRVVGGANV